MPHVPGGDSLYLDRKYIDMTGHVYVRTLITLTRIHKCTIYTVHISIDQPVSFIRGILAHTTYMFEKSFQLRTQTLLSWERKWHTGTLPGATLFFSLEKIGDASKWHAAKASALVPSAPASVTMYKAAVVVWHV